MTLVAMAINAGAYYLEVQHLYSFITPEQIAAFSSLSKDFHYVTAVILTGYLGLQSVLDWKNTTSSTVSQVTSFVSEKIDKKEKIDIDETIKALDVHVEVLEEGMNAPSLKPFGNYANED
jgi:hypothetical protein